MVRKVIEVKNLVKRYGDILALSGVSFEVYRGETFALVGPNGAGKTTTVEILECLRIPTSGEARVLGMDVTEQAEEIKRRIGVLPQEFSTFERLTVEENVSLIAKIYNREDNVRRILETFGLWDVRKRMFGSLSGGMKRRVGVAMALVSEPEIVFLDEPTTGLDPQARQDLWQVIRELRRKATTVFLTTHYMEEVEALADRASLILSGRILVTDSVSKLISRYGGGFRINTRGRKAAQLLRKLGGEVVSQNGEVTAVFKSQGEALEALLILRKSGIEARMIEPSMNEVFLNLAGGRINERGEMVP